MEIIIDGWRAGGEERKEAASVPIDQLPALSDEQRVVAKKLGISEEAYARSAYAGQKNQGRLIEKSMKFAKLLQKKLQARADFQLGTIRLDVLKHRYEVVGTEDARHVSFFVSEDLIDELLQSGSENAERSLDRVLDYAFPAHAA
jgi:hypothetical protein